MINGSNERIDNVYQNRSSNEFVYLYLFFLFFPRFFFLIFLAIKISEKTYPFTSMVCKVKLIKMTLFQMIQVPIQRFLRYFDPLSCFFQCSIALVVNSPPLLNAINGVSDFPFLPMAFFSFLFLYFNFSLFFLITFILFLFSLSFLIN